MDELLSQHARPKVRKEAPARSYPVKPGHRYAIIGDKPFRAQFEDSGGQPLHITPEGHFWKGEAPPGSVGVSTTRLCRFVDLQPDRSEVPDQTPLEVGIPAPLTLDQEMARFFRDQQARLEERGAESLDEAYDFEVEDEPEPWSPHELEEIPWHEVEADPELPPASSEKEEGDPLPAEQNDPKGSPAPKDVTGGDPIAADPSGIQD